MIRTVTRFSALAVALAFVGCAIISLMSKPYQQDLILISLGLKSPG